MPSDIYINTGEGKSEKATEAKELFDQAWQWSDVELTGSRIL